MSLSQTESHIYFLIFSDLTVQQDYKMISHCFIHQSARKNTNTEAEPAHYRRQGLLQV